MFVLQREAPALTCEEEEASGTAKRMRQQAAGLVCTGICLFLHNQSKLQNCQLSARLHSDEGAAAFNQQLWSMSYISGF